MKNVEMVELLKKYKPMIENGLVSVDDLLNCTDEEMKVYQSIDIESIMKLLNSLVNTDSYTYNVMCSFLLNFLSLVEIRKNKSNIDSYLLFSEIISNLNEETVSSFDSLSRVFNIVNLDESEYRDVYIKFLQKIMESTDDIDLKHEKIFFLRDHIALRRSGVLKDVSFLYDFSSVLEAQDVQNVSQFSEFLYRFNTEKYDKETYIFIRDIILKGNPKASKGLVELALDYELIKQKNVFMPMFFYNLYPYSEISNLFKDKKLLSLSFSDYISTIFFLGNALNKNEKCKFLFDMAVNEKSISSPSRDSDMKLISECDNFDVIYSLFRVATSKDSLNSSHHDDDMKLIKSLDGEPSEFIKWKASTLANIASSKESLNSPHHREDMNFIHSLEWSDGLDLSDLNLDRVATDSSSLSSSYHRYNMEFLLENGYDKYYMLYNFPGSLNSKYHQFNLETLKSFSSHNKNERNLLIKLLTNAESLQSGSHMENVLDFIEKIESRGTTVDLLIDELSVEPDRELSEPGRVLQKVRIPDKKVES